MRVPNWLRESDKCWTVLIKAQTQSYREAVTSPAAQNTKTGTARVVTAPVRLRSIMSDRNKFRSALPVKHHQGKARLSGQPVVGRLAIRILLAPPFTWIYYSGSRCFGTYQ